MAGFATLIGLLLLLVVISYSLFYGDLPRHQGGPIGFMHYMLTGGACEALRKIIVFFCGARAGDAMDWCGDYVWNKPNPLMQGLFVFISGGALILYYRDVHPLVLDMGVPMIHSYLFAASALQMYLSWVIACRADPGSITFATASRFTSIYPWDRVVYVARECSTCKLVRPARSKHCRTCDRCVLRFDHHCPWLNNCVGALNFRWFLWFLAATSWTMLYGCFILYSALSVFVQREGIWGASFVNQRTGKRFTATPMVVVQYLMARFTIPVGLGFFAIMMGACVGLFGLFHVYQAARNITTNEGFKYDDVKRLIRGIASRKAYVKRTGKEPLYASVLQKQIHPDMQLPASEKDVVNAYNRGAMANLSEALLPHRFFRHAAARAKKSS